MSISPDSCCQKKARLIQGTLGSALTTTTASVTISSPVAMDGGELPTGTITGYNVYITKGMSGPSGAECVAVWNESASTPRYEFIYVEGIVQTVVTDWRYDTTTHKFQKKTRSLVGWWDDNESDWTDISSGQPVSQSLVTDVEFSTNLTHDKKDTYVLEAGSESTDTVVTTASQSVVTDVEDATTYLTHDKKTLVVFSAGSESTDNVVALDDCP